MKHLLLTASLLLGSGSLVAAPISFDFKDPKGVNAVQFSLDSLLEPIAGTASGVSGTVHYDPTDPTATTGKVVVATESLVLPNSTMQSHLLGDGWLDAKKHPEIAFEIEKLTDVQAVGATVKANAVGKFTLKGVTKDITVPVSIAHLPGAFGKRNGKPEQGGDLLVVRGEFTIERADYGIKPGQNEDKVSPQVKLNLALVGGAPKA